MVGLPTTHYQLGIGADVLQHSEGGGGGEGGGGIAHTRYVCLGGLSGCTKARMHSWHIGLLAAALGGWTNMLEQANEP